MIESGAGFGQHRDVACHGGNVSVKFGGFHGVLPDPSLQADAAYHGLLGAATGAPMVKFALLAFSASVVLSEASARTRIRA